MTMDARKQRILEAIVAIYSTGGEPVGSGLLASHFDMALSSATLRNEMAALTKLGLLEQPHTSAGRVPSPKGYRYYLDHLLEAPAAIALSAADRENIDRLFADMDVEPESWRRAPPAHWPIILAVPQWLPPRRPRICASPILRSCRSGGIPPQFWRLPAPAVCAPVWRVSTPA